MWSENTLYIYQSKGNEGAAEPDLGRLLASERVKVQIKSTMRERKGPFLRYVLFFDKIRREK